MTSRFASLTIVCFLGHRKIIEDKDTRNTKWSMKVARSCSLITWKRKDWMNLRKWHFIWHFMSKQERKKEFVQCIIKHLLDFCDIQNNQGLSKVRLRLITPTSTLTLIILDITKTSSSNCLLLWKASMRCRIKQFARESVRLCPFRGLYVREFKLSHSYRVNRTIKITHAHNLFVKMLDFSPFTIRT